MRSMVSLNQTAGRFFMKPAQDVIVGGRILEAYELHEMGIVDVLAPNGEGKQATLDWI